MNTKYAVTLACLITASAIAYIVLTMPNKPNTDPEHTTHSHSQTYENKELSSTFVERNGQVLSTGKPMLQARNQRLEAAENTEESLIVARDSIIWHESEHSKTMLQQSGFIPADVNEEVYIEVDLDELLTVEVGEQLDLYIPQLGGSYNGEVDHVQYHQNGDRTVEAFIPGAGSLYSAVITIGDNAIYGNIATQEDVFILEGVGKHAWLAPKSAMIAKHQERTPTPSTDTKDVFSLPTELSPTTSNNN